MVYCSVLKNKKILITAGPTWVAIDSVRVISNIASGETGVILAEKLERLGAKVTLLLGPVSACCISNKIRLLPFKFFEELKEKIEKELRAHKYDILIHSAAVADYRPKKVSSGKISSGVKNLRLDLVPTEKIIKAIKKIDKDIFLVGFKFEPQAKKQVLLKEARNLMRSTGADLVVANSAKNGYLAYLVSAVNNHGPFNTKESMSMNLIKLIR